MTRVLLVAGTAAAIWAAGVAVTGGFDVRVAGVSLRSHNALPAAVVALLCFAAALWRGLASIRDALAWFWIAAERRAAWLAAAIAAVAVAIGAAWATNVAGGPDSYCYINQAELLARGRVVDVEPLGADAPWTDRKWTFVPTGHVPSPGTDGEFVPMCAAGYPLLMAAARVVGGRAAMFWVVPIMGGLAVWLTFVLGRRVAGPIAGIFAASLLATSPTFLYQIVQPMTDVPAAALWTLAILSAMRASSAAGTVLAGAATGGALMVRPNLLPLAVVVGLIAARLPLAAWIRSLLLFGAGLAPFALAVAAFNATMYGGPLKSGYGTLGALFAMDRVLPNLARYPVWLVQTETPFILLALAAPWVVSRDTRRAAWSLLAFAAAAFGCYLAYDVFDAWWYLRFVLPAFPPLFVLASAVFVLLVTRLPLPARTAAVFAASLAVAAFHLYTAERGDVFRLRGFEQRFRAGGEYVAQHLPAEAAVVTFMQSGSVRFYSGRSTLVWTAIAPEQLDRALDYLRSRGRRPYLLFEGSEEEQFRKKFSGHSPLGSLEWPPMADINRQVKIYDPLDQPRFLRGERVETRRIWPR